MLRLKMRIAIRFKEMAREDGREKAHIALFNHLMDLDSPLVPTGRFSMRIIDHLLQSELDGEQPWYIIPWSER